LWMRSAIISRPLTRLAPPGATRRVSSIHRLDRSPGFRPIPRRCALTPRMDRSDSSECAT
jgi:hypothetical protein